MDTEKFIECVKKYPILYNSTYNDYKNYAKKLRTWDIVAEEMNESSEYVQTRWKGLKDGYTKYKRQVKPYKDWCWGPDMQFFEPFLKHRKIKEYSKRLDLSSASMQSPTQSILDISVKTEPCILDTRATTSGGEGYISEQQPLESTSTLETGSHTSSTESDEDIDNVNFNSTQKRAKRTKRDANFYLFMSYAETFKKLSVRTQANLKVQMAKLFAEAELQEFKMNQNST